MIQRIQTIFLLLAALALGLLLWFPVIQLENQNFKDAMKGWEIGHSTPIGGDTYIVFFNAIFVGTAIGLSLINILLFKNRGLQMLVCWFAILLTASAAAFVYYKYYTKPFYGFVIYTPWNALSAVAVAFLILAVVYIRKDEETIKGLDRLR